jgi:hypothetical protein
MARRASSTLVRKWCFDYWKTPDEKLVCYKCGAALDPKKSPKCWEAEHDLPHNLGGSDKPPNVKPICAPEFGGCHAEKTKVAVARYAKGEAVRAKRYGFRRSKTPIPGSRGTRWAKRYNKITGRWETIART